MKRVKVSCYMRFLALCHSLDHSSNQRVDQMAVRLLEEVALAECRQLPLTVSQSMGLRQIASPATIHRKLQDLVKAGLVEFRFPETNRRTKHIHPTKAAKAYFEKRAALLMKSVQTT